jgi:hypothetical protein
MLVRTLVVPSFACGGRQHRFGASAVKWALGTPSLAGCELLVGQLTDDHNPIPPHPHDPIGRIDLTV